MSERTGGRIIFNTRALATVLLLAFALLILAGCNIGSASGATDPNRQPGEATPDASANTLGEDAAPRHEASIALVRPAGDPETILGSAVVLSEDGMLITAAGLLSGNAEVVLPDGQVHLPALVATQPVGGLALLKVPAQGLVPVQFSADRLDTGATVYAAGYDGSPESVGRMSGIVLDAVEDPDAVEFRVRGPLFVDTDITLVDGFVGGVLSDDDDQFTGVLIPGEDAEGRKIIRSVSSWFVTGWLESRQDQLEALSAEAEGWERISLPGGWSMARPDDWSISVETNDEDNYRAELAPSDPDAVLQFSISVEPNGYGVDPETFLEEEFGDRASARIWGVDRAHGRPLVRLSMSQEGALVDVAYLLDRDHLIAVSLTSGYLPGDDHIQAERARTLFETVLNTLTR